MIVDTPEAIDRVGDTAKLAKELGCNVFTAAPVISFGRAAGSQMLHSDILMRLSDSISEARSIHGDFVMKGSSFGEINIEQYGGCGAGKRALSINWSGQCKLCPMQPIAWLTLGSVFDITSDKFQKTLKSYFAIGHPNIEICGDCEYSTNCIGCFVRAINLLKSSKTIVEKCRWYQANAEMLNSLEMSF